MLKQYMLKKENTRRTKKDITTETHNKRNKHTQRRGASCYIVKVCMLNLCRATRLPALAGARSICVYIYIYI